MIKNEGSHLKKKIWIKPKFYQLDVKRTLTGDITVTFAEDDIYTQHSI
jgi:hypothetical protein